MGDAHTQWCSRTHGPKARCRHLIGTVGPITVGLVATRTGRPIVRLLDTITQASLDISGMAGVDTLDLIGQALRRLDLITVPVRTTVQVGELPILGDGYDLDPVVINAVLAIKGFAGDDIDHSTAAECIELLRDRDALDDKQFTAVLGRFPRYVVTDQGAEA